LNRRARNRYWWNAEQSPIALIGPHTVWCFMIEYLIVAVLLTFATSLLGVPAVAPLLFFPPRGTHAVNSFSLVSLFDLTVPMALVLSISASCLHGIELVSYSAAGMIVGSFWWFVIVRAVSRFSMMREIERSTLLVVAIPFVFVGAVYVVGIVCEWMFPFYLEGPDREWETLRRVVVLFWSLLVLILHLYTRYFKKRELRRLNGGLGAKEDL